MMTQKPAPNFGQSKGIPFIVITSNLELQLHVPKEERLSNPLKYIDVTRTTLATIPATARHDHLWPAMWSGTGKAAQRKEGKTALGDRETEARQCEKVERHLFFLIRRKRKDTSNMRS